MHRGPLVARRSAGGGVPVAVPTLLTIKQGITLRQTPTAKNYTDSVSAVIWDAPANSASNANIAAANTTRLGIQHGA